MSLNKRQSKVDFRSCVAHRQLESVDVRDTSAGPSRSDPLLVSPACGSSPSYDILEGYMIAHKVPTRSQRPPSGTSFHKVGGGLSEEAPSFTITSPRYGVKEATVRKGPSFSYARLPHRPVITSLDSLPDFSSSQMRVRPDPSFLATHHSPVQLDRTLFRWAGLACMSRLFICRTVLRNAEVTYFPARFFLASRLACTPRCCTSKANRGERSIWIINAGHLLLLQLRGIIHQGELRRDAAVTMRARR